MGLEKLRSVFAEGAGISNSSISGRYEKGGSQENIGEWDGVQPMEDIFGNRTQAWDFFGGINSYKQTLNPSIPGFTKNFNLGGYTFGDGQIGNSQYLNISSDAQKRTIEIPSLVTDGLGFGEYQAPEFDDDIRFTAGLGWPFANTILQVSKEGNSASLFYTTTDG